MDDLKCSQPFGSQYGKTEGVNLVWHGHAVWRQGERAEEAYVKLVMFKEGVRDAISQEWKKTW